MKITKNDIREAILEALNEEPEAVPGPKTGTGDINSAERSLAVQIYEFFLQLAAEEGIDLSTLRNPLQINLNQLAAKIKSDQAGKVDFDKSRLATGQAVSKLGKITNPKKDKPVKPVQEEGCGDQMHMPAQEPQMHQDISMQHHHGDDGESEMAKSQLYRASQYAGELEQMILDGDQLDAWVQAKITKASDYLSSVKHYLQYKKSKGEH